MYKYLFKVVVFVSTISFTACFFIGNTSRTGVRYDALPDDCPINFVSNSASINQGDYELLGNVTTNGDSFTESVKSKLRRHVCNWGGDTVTIMQGSSAVVLTATTFNILRKRTEKPIEQIPCTGKYINSSGAELIFSEDGAVTMGFNGNNVQCTSQSYTNNKTVINCNNNTTEGTFSSDCSKIEFNGMDYNKN